VDADVSQAGTVAKHKKKKFSIIALARKSLMPKKAVRTAENVRVTAH